MNEKTYLFNPFIVENYKDEELATVYAELHKSIDNNAVSPYDVAKNIEVYANMNYLIGEIIARVSEEYIGLKNNIEIEKSKYMYNQRKQWNETTSEKAPAMSYFEALATEYRKNDINRLAHLDSKLKRFKNAYDSIENKMNAIKKKLDAMKYEEFNK